jgi:hypothetical protein
VVLTRFADPDDVEKQVAIYRSASRSGAVRVHLERVLRLVRQVTKPAWAAATQPPTRRATRFSVLSALRAASDHSVHHREIWHEVAPKLGIAGDSITALSSRASCLVPHDGESGSNRLTGIRRIRSG